MAALTRCFFTGSCSRAAVACRMVPASEELVAVFCVCIGMTLFKSLRARRRRNQSGLACLIPSSICKDMCPVAVRKVPSSYVTSAARLTDSNSGLEDSPSDTAGLLRVGPPLTIAKVTDEARVHQNGVEDDAYDEEKVEKTKRRIAPKTRAPVDSISVAERIKKFDSLASGAHMPTRRGPPPERVFGPNMTSPRLKTVTETQSSTAAGRSCMNESMLAAQKRYQDIQSA